MRHATWVPRIALRTLGAAGVLAAAAAGPGCQTLTDLAARTGRPEARVVSAGLEGLTLDGAALLFDVEVVNPYAVDLPLANLDYSLATGTSPFLTGRAPLSGAVPAGGSRIVSLPARISFPDLLAAARDVRPGSVIDYRADLGLGVDAPGVGPLTVPLRKEGRLPVPTVPAVTLQSIQWDSLSLDEAAARLRLEVTNRNEFAADLARFDYRLSLGGTPIVATAVERSAALPARGTGTIELPISFAPGRLGLAVFNMLTGKSASYELAGTMQFDTPFGPLALPVDQSGTTEFVRP